MKKTTKDISLHQYIYMLFLASMIYNIVFIPGRIITIVGRDLWLAIVLYNLLDFFHLAVFYICEKINPDLTIDQILEKSLGKIPAKIILIIFAIYVYIRLTVMYHDFTLYACDVVFSPNWRPIITPIILVSLYCVFKGIRSIARMTEILGPGIVFVMVLTMFGIITTSDLSNVLPILEYGFKPIVIAFYNFQFFAADYLCLFCILGRVKVEKNFGLNISLPLIASAVFTILFSISYFGFYENIAVFQKQGHSLIDMSQHLLGNENLARFDFILSVIWMIAILIRKIIYTWILYQCIMVIFELEEKPIIKYIVLGIIGIAVFFGYNYFNLNAAKVLEFINSGFKLIFIITMQILLPLSLPFLTYIASKQERKIQKNNMLFKKQLRTKNQ
ncbi:MAG TPA: GerAB/ArcD/ProY family transporter [Clostridia bacterium]